MGYNFLYGLWKYSWDADCELFLKILQEETKEDVYTQQIQLQASISTPLYSNASGLHVFQAITGVR